MKDLLKPVLVLGAAVALLLPGGTGAVAETAPADGVPCAETTSPRGAVGCFKPDGDHIIALDDAPDGHHVEVFWSVGRYSGVCKNTYGYYKDQTPGRQVKDCNQNFAEHSTVCLRSAVVEGDALVGDYSTRRCYDTTSGRLV